MSVRLFFAVAAAAAIAACTSAETSVTPSAAPRCDIQAQNTPSTFTATGGNGTLAVTTARDCTWTVTTDASWVTIAGSRTGQGEASVSYSVAANPVPTPRSGTIGVGSEHVELSQAAAPCRFTLNHGGDSIGFGGGRLSVDVSTLNGCTWSAAPSQSWVSVVSGQSGNANGTVTLSVSANSGGRRVAVVNIASESYTVTQDGAPAPPEPSPAPPSPSPAPPAPSPSPSPTPPPVPTPTPAPPPGPAPPPPAPTAVHLEGSAAGVSGGCPNISFSLGGANVVADGSTDYKKGDCGDVRNGRSLKVDGVKSGGSVRATRIEIGKDDKGDQ